MDPMRRTLPDDISRPLRNSMIHTGHGDPWGKSWGNPSSIDPMYLGNPMDPPDVLGLPTQAGRPVTSSLKDRRKPVGGKRRLFDLDG